MIDHDVSAPVQVRSETVVRHRDVPLQPPLLNLPEPPPSKPDPRLRWLHSVLWLCSWPILIVIVVLSLVFFGLLVGNQVLAKLPTASVFMAGGFPLMVGLIWFIFFLDPTGWPGQYFSRPDEYDDLPTTERFATARRDLLAVYGTSWAFLFGASLALDFLMAALAQVVARGGWSNGLLYAVALLGFFTSLLSLSISIRELRRRHRPTPRYRQHHDPRIKHG